MRSLYIQHADYEAFSLAETTTPDKIASASALVNALLNRPEGLLLGDDGVTMQATGEPIVEYRTVSGRGLVVLSRAPIAALVEMSWAYLPHGSWTLVDPAGAHVEHWTGRVIPPLGVPFGSRLCVKYVAGWTYETLPDVIKQATALLVQSGLDLQGIPRGAKRAKAGDTEVEFFGKRDLVSVLGPDVVAALGPYTRIAG